MKILTKDMTQYFKTALASQTMREIDFKGGRFWEIPFESLEKGKISKETAGEFLKHINKSRRLDHTTKNREEDKTSEKALFCLKTIRISYTETVQDNSKAGELTGVFFLPAMLDSKGLLAAPDSNSFPWIPRTFLEPMTEPQISIGKVSDLDRFLGEWISQRKQIESWNDYYSYAKRLYEAVFRTPFNRALLNTDSQMIGFEGYCYLFADDIVNASFHIMDLYKSLHETIPDSKLYEQFLNQEIEPAQPLIPLDDTNSMMRHVGQMNGEYPLSDSQREALNQFEVMKEGEILAVSGPPGTGKTTLIQSIVANMYVRHALNEDRAPIIIATSTNNQESPYT
ncbi:MAG: hypothetical protein FWG14_07245 [Peptococcaceae bacterium]|nr:hypothetical protein [Peptococcaceae bacterium]